MPTYKLPNRGRIRQLNRGDLLGELWETKNVDLTQSEGKIRLAPATTRTTTATALDGDPVTALAYYDVEGKYFALTDDRLLESDDPTGAFAEVTDHSVSTGQDLIVFLGKLLVAQSTDIDYWDGALSAGFEWVDSWWDGLTGKPSLTASYPHIMETSSGGTILYVTDKNRIHSYNGTISAGTFHTLTIADTQVACCIKDADNRVWIGTYTESAETAYVYEWDGAATQATHVYPINARAALSLEIVNGVPHIITERGEIKVFTGAGFETVCRLPFSDTRSAVADVAPGSVQIVSTLRPVHPKGMKYHNGKLFLFANFTKAGGGTAAETYLANTPTGVWVADLTTGSLSHRTAISNSQTSQQSSPLLLLENNSSRFLVGGELDETGGEGLWIEDYSAVNYGHLTSTEIAASSILDVYDTVYVKASLGTSDVISLKYRTEKKYTSTPRAGITWTNTTTFTTTADLSDVAVGEEVEVLQGAGKGRLVHITAISYANPTYTVTVDTAIGTAAATSDIAIDNWTLHEESMTESGVKNFGLGIPTYKVQVRLYLVGTSIEVEEILIHTNTKQAP